MRQFSKVSPSFWTGTTGKAMRAAGRDAQVLGMYLITSAHANMLGLYRLPRPYIEADTGLSPKIVVTELARMRKIGFASYDQESEMVWVHEMARWQLKKVGNSADNICIGANNQFAVLPVCAFTTLFHEKYRDFLLLREMPTTSPELPGDRDREERLEKEMEIERAPKALPEGLSRLIARMVELGHSEPSDMKGTRAAYRAAQRVHTVDRLLAAIDKANEPGWAATEGLAGDLRWILNHLDRFLACRSPGATTTGPVLTTKEAKSIAVLQRMVNRGGE